MGKKFIIICLFLLPFSAFAHSPLVSLNPEKIEWLPKNDGHNVEFFVVPEMNSLPATSEIDDAHSVVFTVSGIYLYGCTPHADMGMIALIIVGNNFHNLEALENTKLSRVAKTVLKRLITIAQSAPKS
jgi:hypothetical protein